MALQRRRFLAATGTITATLAGCVESDDEEILEELRSDGDDEPTQVDGNGSDDSGTGDGSDDDTDDDRLTSEDLDHEVFQSASRPPAILGSGSGLIDKFLVISDREDIPEAHGIGGEPIEDEELLEWLETTDFDRSTVVWLSAIVPASAYDRLILTGVTVGEEEEELSISVRFDTEEEASVDVDPPIQGLPRTSAVVRVTGDGVPAEATVSVTNHWSEYDWFDLEESLLDPAQMPGRIAPEGGPLEVPEAIDCGDGPERSHIAKQELLWGNAYSSEGELSWAMRIHDEAETDRPLAFERGAEITITMTNVSRDSLMIGAKTHAVLEMLTADGWMDLGTSAEVFGPSYPVSPGDGHEWSLSLTADDVAEVLVHPDDATVCEPLPAGRYRFAYPVETGYLVVAFDLLE